MEIIDNNSPTVPSFKPKLQRVLDKYIENGQTSKAKAYQDVYKCSKSSSYSQAARIFARDDVQLYIELMSRDAHIKAIEKYEVTVDRVYQELTRLAYYNIQDFYDAAGNPIPIQQLNPDLARAIMGFNPDGSYKLPDKGQNLDRLAKTLGMFKAEASHQAVIVVNAPVINKPKKSGT